MKDYSEKLFKELEQELILYSEMGIPPVRKLVGALNCISVAMDKLKIHLKEAGFKSNPDEIEFFKYDKPKYICEQIFALEIFSITANKAIKDKFKVKKFYEKELQFISRFFDQYQFLY